MFSTIASKSYDQYIHFCQDPQVIKQVRESLGLKPREARILLSAYTFRYFPQEVINGPILSVDRVIMAAATEMTQQAERAERVSLAGAINCYTDMFTAWKLQDQSRVAYPFLVKFNQLRRLRVKTETERRFYTTELKLLTDMTHLNLLGMIHRLGGETELARLDRLDDLSEDLSFSSEFTNAATTAFWGTFREQLPSYDHVVPLLIDFAHRYKCLIPNRTDLHEQLAETLDIEFIRQKIDTGVMTADELCRYLRFIVQSIKILESPEEEQAFEDKMLAIIETPCDPVALLERFFTTLFEHLDQLTLRIAHYHRGS